jgi:hypothetical protein
MQTVEWMSYSGSSHFSDTNLYKILFISSFCLKAMNLARFAQILELFVKQRTGCLFSPRGSEPQQLTSGTGQC